MPQVGDIWESYRANEFVLIIDGIPSPGISKISGLSEGEIETIELEQIHVALDLADGIISEAARLLSLKRTTLIEKMRKYGVQQQAA